MTALGETAAATRSSAWRVPIPLAGFLLVIAAGTAGTLAGFGEAVQRAHGDVVTGAWTASLEHELAQRSLVRDVALPIAAAGQYALFGEGRRGVLVGPDGWLFTAEEIEPPAPGAREDNLADITAAAAALAARGTALVVALIPDKIRIVPDGPGEPAYNEARYDEARAALIAAGITVPDLRPALAAIDGGRGAYLHRDTHWTPAGAAAAATLVAEAAGPQGDADFETEARPPILHDGDLMRYVPLGPFAETFGLGPEEVPGFVTTERGAAIDAAALLGDAAAPVILVGTSYSAMEEWNFAGALAERLGAAVENHADPGRGPIAPMLDYLEDPAAGQAPPRLVIWEIPERYLDRPGAAVTPS